MMAKARTGAVDKFGHSSGEELERASRRRRFAIVGALFALGMGAGAYGGWKLAETRADLTQPWSPTIRHIIAGLYLAAMIFGSIALDKHLDEVERQVQYKAAAVAGGAYAVVYPTWFLLWKGGFVAEPIHWVLFILFWVALASSTLYYRNR